MRAGREFYAVGGNRQAAKDAGIPVTRRIFTGFMISGFVAALAGVINTLERTAATPTAGSTVLLASFAAAIIGGVALNGGRGSVIGTLIGALSLGLLQIALTLGGCRTDIQQIFIGGVLFLAVVTDPASLRAVASTSDRSFGGRRANSGEDQSNSPPPVDATVEIGATRPCEDSDCGSGRPPVSPRHGLLAGCGSAGGAEDGSPRCARCCRRAPTSPTARPTCAPFDETVDKLGLDAHRHEFAV